MNKSKKYTFIIVLYLILYFIISLNYLEIFPFVHSDEPWLSGLTRNMMENGSIFATETFFDLFPRFPHCIKVLFHLIQMPFILIFGYDIFSVRLISLIFGTISLLLFYKICCKLFGNYLYSILITVLLSFNIQFIYASHFARQEIIIVFVLMLGFYYYLSRSRGGNTHIFLGLIIGLSVGIHPNSFVVAIVFGLLYVIDIIYKHKKVRNLLILIGTTGLTALIFVILSFIGDADFISHYTSFGESLGVSSSIIDKILTMPNYYMNLFNGISGTYYTPPIKVYLNVFGIVFLISIVYLIISRLIKKVIDDDCLPDNLMILKLLICIVGINIGFIIIGRYNQTNVVFVFPFFYLLVFALFSNIINYSKKFMIIFMVILIGFSFYLTFEECSVYGRYDYNDYLDELEIIPQGVKTLGNLNMEFYFENGMLLDYRNLTYLEENNMSFEDYINHNNIEYIVFMEELDYIHRNSGWSILYGEDYYYDDMKRFIEENCRLVHEFRDSLYGIRISRYMMDYEWGVWIYRVEK
ncbi:hypothetical protein SH1V18_45210 [Vallitalea longa]|uniref:ArnT-like N-terminal domain-containing protein n=1 Tax=Vallitalea longa TaxID=2936439 RepID=A0A9W6DG86_9FIRM|nr:phospholipid carrier-dependent glycosyltransferase [Vallitalea longa]GKX32041.1 hypothetical protein SH1V18_45210 [Vallitalea longa]